MALTPPPKEVRQRSILRNSNSSSEGATGRSSMLTLERRKLLLRVADVFFYGGESPLPEVDVVFFFHSAAPQGRAREVRTLHLDLSRSEDALFAQCARNNRYKISRAGARDGLSFRMFSKPSEQQTATFLAFYDGFARGMGLAGVSSHKVRKIEALRSTGGLWISRIQAPDGEDLCYHSYIVDGRRARLFHSASHFRAEEGSARRSLIGRANRYLHWRGILHFKALDLAIYDFGGLTPGSEEHRNIDEFKLSFGGAPVTEFSGVEGRTLLGRIATCFVDRGPRATQD